MPALKIMLLSSSGCSAPAPVRRSSRSPVLLDVNPPRRVPVYSAPTIPRRAFTMNFLVRALLRRIMLFPFPGQGKSVLHPRERRVVGVRSGRRRPRQLPRGAAVQIRAPQEQSPGRRCGPDNERGNRAIRERNSISSLPNSSQFFGCDNTIVPFFWMSFLTGMFRPHGAGEHRSAGR